MIKTLKPKEKKLLFTMLDKLLEHFSKSNNNSKIAKIYGVFTLWSNFFSPVDVLMMQNTVVLKNKNNPKMTFDLKGSQINRYV